MTLVERATVTPPIEPPYVTWTAAVSAPLISPRLHDPALEHVRNGASSDLLHNYETTHRQLRIMHIAIQQPSVALYE
jgi:hypothetical protein